MADIVRMTASITIPSLLEGELAESFVHRLIANLDSRIPYEMWEQIRLERGWGAKLTKNSREMPHNVHLRMRMHSPTRVWRVTRQPYYVEESVSSNTLSSSSNHDAIAKQLVRKIETELWVNTGTPFDMADEAMP